MVRRARHHAENVLEQVCGLSRRLGHMVRMTFSDQNRARDLRNSAAQVMPGGLNSANRAIEPEIDVRHAAGSYLEDVDGKRYLDYHAAFGPIMLGHSYPEVIDSATRAMRDLDLFGVGVTESEVLLAQKLVQHIPSVDEVLLCNSGSEATYHAVRLARAATGRQKLLKFQGCYHGWHDAVLRNMLSAPERVGQTRPWVGGHARSPPSIRRWCVASTTWRTSSATLQANPEQVAASSWSRFRTTSAA